MRATSPMLLSVLSIAITVLFCASARAASLQLLYQNDGDWVREVDDSRRQPGYLLATTPVSASDAAKACGALNEKLYVPGAQIDPGLEQQLAYLVLKGQYAEGQALWVDSSTTSDAAIAGRSALAVPRAQRGRTRAMVSSRADQDQDQSSHAALIIGGKQSQTTVSSKTADQMFPVLCTQSAPRHYANETDFSALWRVQTGHWLGFRDALSFRFHNVPYATNTQRFEQSKVLTPTDLVNATDGNRSGQCPQGAGTDYAYTEQCLVLNVFTPALSDAAQTTKDGGQTASRPVMLWLHGGGFSSGSGLDQTFDGGSLASRGDVVVVTPNYRLGTLGFLAIDTDGEHANYGFGDVITALQWVKENIHYFGGDPSAVTVFGQSAGAQLVSALMGSKAAQGLFHRAIVQSGRPSDNANALQSVKDSLADSGSSSKAITAVGCSTKETTENLLECLRAVPAGNFLNVSPKASALLVDGHLITQRRLNFGKGFVQPGVPLLQGFMRDELGSLGSGIPSASETNLDAGLKSAGVSDGNRTTIESKPDLFPPSGPGGVQNTTVSVVTDITSIARCGQEATLYAAAQSGALSAGLWGYYQNQRSIQIPNYDPYAICQQTSAGQPYYL